MGLATEESHSAIEQYGARSTNRIIFILEKPYNHRRNDLVLKSVELSEPRRDPWFENFQLDFSHVNLMEPIELSDSKLSAIQCILFARTLEET